MFLEFQWKIFILCKPFFFSQFKHSSYCNFYFKLTYRHGECKSREYKNDLRNIHSTRRRATFEEWLTIVFELKKKRSQRRDQRGSFVILRGWICQYESFYSDTIGLATSVTEFFRRDDDLVSVRESTLRVIFQSYSEFSFSNNDFIHMYGYDSIPGDYSQK